MGDVVNFQEKRERKVERKRRMFERVMFEHAVSCCLELDNKEAILPVTLVDISHEGCLFQIAEAQNTAQGLQNGKNATLRFYFTKNNYLPIDVLVRYGNEFVDQRGHRFIRYGCEFDKSTNSFQVLNVFIDFIYKFAQHSGIDKGDVKVFSF